MEHTKKKEHLLFVMHIMLSCVLLVLTSKIVNTVKLPLTLYFLSQSQSCIKDLFS